MLSNGMVIQRNKPYPIRGNSEPHANVSASFRDTLYQAKADAQGDWTITLPSFPAGGPYELTIVEAKTTVISDILIGDVWILGGQSNMELPIKRTLDRHQKDIENHHYPFIRQFNVPQVYDFSGPCSTIIKGDWIQATGEAIDHFSAVGYFFALAISQSENVPIGLILTAVGGTPAHAWVSEASYRQTLPDAAKLAEVQHPLHVQETIAADSKRIDQWHYKLNATDPGLKKPVWYQQTEWTKQWTSIQLPTRFTESLLNYRGSIWFRKEFHLYSEQATATSSLLKLGTIVDADETYLNGELVGQTGYKYPPRRYSIRSNLLKPGKNVLIVRVICKESTGGFVANMPYELNLLDQSIDLSGEWHYRVGAQLEPLQPQTFFQTKPTGLYNGMIAPLKQHPITGFLWYQGESDTQAPAHYEEMFQAVINDWRTLFQQGDLPFLFVQLANFKADTAEETGQLFERSSAAV
ncbi:sialic acid-specific 9-O-acetylesterase [Bacillus sp. JCM 19046]|nr:sialic acid-specific 9-O-acetylesterase [Bacillus sp. JCM 19046]